SSSAPASNRFAIRGSNKFRGTREDTSHGAVSPCWQSNSIRALRHPDAGRDYNRLKSNTRRGRCGTKFTQIKKTFLSQNYIELNSRRRFGPMKFRDPKIPMRFRVITAATCLALFAGCATTPQTASRLQYAPAASILREARSSQVPVETRAADYLQVAAMTAPLLGTGAQETPARDCYKAACGELTMLLRSSEAGRLW